MGRRSYDQSKADPASTVATPQNLLRSRPFALQPQPTSERTLADMQAQLDHAQRFGHHLSNFTPSQPQSPTPTIQPKLTIGAPGDKYEQEADRVASQVVQRLQFSQMESPQEQQSVQRESMLEEDELHMKPLDGQIQREEMPEEDELQMKPLVQHQADGGGEGSADLESGIARARGGGQALEPGLQQQMDQVMGADFSGVRVHTDAQAHQLNQSIQAKAFTTGQDIFFREGAYQPSTESGRQLLAHELTHVMQQGAAVPVQQMPSTRIQRTMAGAYDTLVGEGGGITHSARAKKVFTLGLGKSTYDQLLDATSKYEKEEKRGKKKTPWFLNQLNLIVTLCNEWLNDKTHIKEVNAKDKSAVSRESAIRTLLVRAQNEQLSLGDGNSGEKEKEEKDSFFEESELEISLGKQEKMPTSSSPSVTPKYNFGFEASTSTAQQREAIFTKYVDNCRLAGLPLEQVLGIARRIIGKWDGWESPYVLDFNYGYLEKFSDLLQDEVKGASRELVNACFTMNPNLKELQLFAQEFGSVTTSMEDDFALDNEEEFLKAAAKQFDNTNDDLAFIKLWKTAGPPLRRQIYNLVSLNKQVRGLTTMGYLVEALDKKHRYDLNSLLSSWTNSSTQVDFFTWLESQYGASTKTPVRYYNAEERQQFAISVGAVLKRTDGEALSGDNIFVLSQDKILYAANKETTGSVRLHHSSFLSGEPVLAAGHLYTHMDGTLYKIDNSSGHYGPNDFHLAQALAVLKQQGVSLGKVSVSLHKGGTQTAEEFLSAYL